MHSNGVGAKLLILVTLSELREIDVLEGANGETDMTSSYFFLEFESCSLTCRIIGIDDLTMLANERTERYWRLRRQSHHQSRWPAFQESSLLG